MKGYRKIKTRDDKKNREKRSCAPEREFDRKILYYTGQRRSTVWFCWQLKSRRTGCFSSDQSHFDNPMGERNSITKTSSVKGTGQTEQCICVEFFEPLNFRLCHLFSSYMYDTLWIADYFLIKPRLRTFLYFNDSFLFLRCTSFIFFTRYNFGYGLQTRDKAIA